MCYCRTLKYVTTVKQITVCLGCKKSISAIKCCKDLSLKIHLCMIFCFFSWEQEHLFSSDNTTNTTLGCDRQVTAGCAGGLFPACKCHANVTYLKEGRHELALGRFSLVSGAGSTGSSYSRSSGISQGICPGTAHYWTASSKTSR